MRAAIIGHPQLMSAAMEQPIRAWQPITPRGVAAFGSASLRRLLLLQLFVALFAAASVVWFLYAAWFPTVLKGIRELPARGEIRSRELQWEADSPRVLTDGHFLAFVVDLEHRAGVRSPAHIQVEFGRRDFRLIGIFGFFELPYPDGWIVAFNRTELLPWWGAWEPPVLWMTAAVVTLGLGLVWALLATTMFLPVRLLAFFASRDLSSGASWKLCGAALMPGALLMSVGIILYGSGWLDVVQLIILFVAHFLVGWVYAVVSVFWRPKVLPGSKGNPFAGSKDSFPGSRGNPFSSP